MIQPSRYKNIKYQVSKQTALLFIGINPSPGTYERGIPFSNNKTFWYLLHDAGILPQNRNELRDDEKLRALYHKKFVQEYGLGLMNVIARPTRTVSQLKMHEALEGAKRIRLAIRKYQPLVVCFVGKATYKLFAQIGHTEYGWQEPVEGSNVFVMHFPLHGPSSIRIAELREVAAKSGIKLHR